MTVDERYELLRTSVPKDPTDARSRRYNLRRGEQGLELYEAKWTRDVGDEAEFHGHPASYVPGRVLRTFRDEGRITEAEYRKLVRTFE